MKYVISDKGEVNIGSENVYHVNLAKDFSGRVVAAGYCEKNTDGTYNVWGRSIGYCISAKPEDAKLLESQQTEK